MCPITFEESPFDLLDLADVILPRLREVVAHFGSPCAIMRALGRGLGRGIDEARRGLRLWQTQTTGDHRLPKGPAGMATVRRLLTP